MKYIYSEEAAIVDAAADLANEAFSREEQKDPVKWVFLFIKFIFFFLPKGGK